jgi:2'-5' RNA ligase
VPRLRLAAALLIPAPAAGEIDGLRRACGDGSLGRVAPHITLVPPVNVRVDDLPAALAGLRRAAATRTEPLELRLGAAATFHPDSPVVYLSVGGDTAGLQALRDTVFAPPLARSLTWPFVPHVTVADEMDIGRIPAAVAALADYAVDVPIATITMLQEGPGRRWTPVADAMLETPTVVARGGLPVELWCSTLADPEVVPLFRMPETVPDGGRPFVVTARRGPTILGAARGWVRDGRVEVAERVVTEAAGLEDIERHLAGAVGALDPDVLR